MAVVLVVVKYIFSNVARVWLLDFAITRGNTLICVILRNVFVCVGWFFYVVCRDSPQLRKLASDRSCDRSAEKRLREESLTTHIVSYGQSEFEEDEERDDFVMFFSVPSLCRCGWVVVREVHTRQRDTKAE